MYTSILVAVDGSARAPGVLEHAQAIAERFGASIPAEAWTLSGDQLTSVLIDSAHADLDKLATTIPEAHRGSVLCELGKPAIVIENAAEKIGADLVVIGSHGYGALDRVLGTTAARVVNHATRPTLVVR